MIRWVRPPTELAKGIDSYERRLQAAVGELADYWAPQLEASAKQNAPWTDRTGNARQTLFGVVDKETKQVTIYLSHGMEYGQWLELRNSGRYAIVMPTLEAYYGRVKASMQELVR